MWLWNRFTDTLYSPFERLAERAAGRPIDRLLGNRAPDTTGGQASPGPVRSPEAPPAIEVQDSSELEKRPVGEYFPDGALSGFSMKFSPPTDATGAAG